ncbi:MAG: GntR family transcriptional regulator [Thermomicrobiales bacterium]
MEIPEPTSFLIRMGGPDDVAAIAAVHRASMRETMPWLPVLHTPEEDRAWVTQAVLPHKDGLDSQSEFGIPNSTRLSAFGAVDVEAPIETPVGPLSSPPPALSQLAAHALRESILDGRLLPGDRLVERDLAAALQVSRVPVREALRQLGKEGFVSVVPHRGAVVTPVSAALVIDVFAVRMALEGLAARIAAPRMPEETIAALAALVADMERGGREPTGRRLVDQDLAFHRTLAGACERPVLLEALDTIWNKTSLLISASRPAYPLQRIGQLHRLILDAVISRDPDRVEEAVKEHLAFGETILLRHLTAKEAGQTHPRAGDGAVAGRTRSGIRRGLVERPRRC